MPHASFIPAAHRAAGPAPFRRIADALLEERDHCLPGAAAVLLLS